MMIGPESVKRRTILRPVCLILFFLFVSVRGPALISIFLLSAKLIQEPNFEIDSTQYSRLRWKDIVLVSLSHPHNAFLLTSCFTTSYSLRHADQIVLIIQESLLFFCTSSSI